MPRLLQHAQRRTVRCLTAAAIVAASIASPSSAWARYRSTGAETNTFATHVLLTPGRPSCGGLGVLSITLSWTAPTDAAFLTSYELGKSTTSGFGYTYTDVGLVTSKTVSLSTGHQYYVVRAKNHQWVGSTSSPERDVLGVLGLAATCP